MTQPGNNNDNLGTECLKITLYGIILMAIQRFIDQRTTGESVLVTTSFLAIVAIFKILFPIRIYERRAWLRVLCVTMCCLFSWYLIYSAENVRSAYYRLHIQRDKIEALVADAPFYVILSDSDGRITATSRNIELLTGYNPGELTGQPITVLMLDGPSAKYQLAYDKAISLLRDPYGVEQGWLYQGLVKVALKHKSGNIVPVKMFSGGIRWSTDIQFKGDIDMFAIYFPVELKDALIPPTNLKYIEGRQLQQAPNAPNVKSMVPMPGGNVVNRPYDNEDGKIIKAR